MWGTNAGRMHGHGFEAILHVKQELGDKDIGVDYDLLDECWSTVHEKLDHACLNDIPGLENPTSESLAAWIWGRLKPGLPQLSWVTIYETVTAGCHYDGKNYRIWKEQRFESALCLPNESNKDTHQRLHGHSYILRLHLTAELDPIMGWTVDYGDVKELFKPIYNKLDHRLLNDIKELDKVDVASVASWIRRQVSSVLPQMDRVDLFQTPGCGAILSWGEAGPVLPN